MDEEEKLFSYSDILKIKEEVSRELKGIGEKFSNNYQTVIGDVQLKLFEFEKILTPLTKKVDSINEKVMEATGHSESLEELKLFKSRADDRLLKLETGQNSVLANISNLDFQYGRIINENLNYPGILGKGSKFKSLREFIDFCLAEVASLNKFRDQQKSDLRRNKELLDNALASFKKDSEAFTLSIKQYINQKLFENETKFQEFIKVNEDRILDMRVENSKYAVQLQSNCEKLQEEYDNILKIKDDFLETVTSAKAEIIDRTSKIEQYFTVTNKDIKTLKEQYSKLFDSVKELRMKIKGVENMHNEGLLRMQMEPNLRYSNEKRENFVQEINKNFYEEPNANIGITSKSKAEPVKFFESSAESINISGSMNANNNFNNNNINSNPPIQRKQSFLFPNGGAYKKKVKGIVSVLHDYIQGSPDRLNSKSFVGILARGIKQNENDSSRDSINLSKDSKGNPKTLNIVGQSKNAPRELLSKRLSIEASLTQLNNKKDINVIPEEKKSTIENYMSEDNNPKEKQIIDNTKIIDNVKTQSKLEKSSLRRSKTLNDSDEETDKKPRNSTNEEEKLENKIKNSYISRINQIEKMQERRNNSAGQIEEEEKSINKSKGQIKRVPFSEISKELIPEKKGFIGKKYQIKKPNINDKNRRGSPNLPPRKKPLYDFTLNERNFKNTGLKTIEERRDELNNHMNSLSTLVKRNQFNISPSKQNNTGLTVTNLSKNHLPYINSYSSSIQKFDRNLSQKSYFLENSIYNRNSNSGGGLRKYSNNSNNISNNTNNNYGSNHSNTNVIINSSNNNPNKPIIFEDDGITTYKRNIKNAHNPFANTMVVISQRQIENPGIGKSKGTIAKTMAKSSSDSKLGFYGNSKSMAETNREMTFNQQKELIANYSKAFLVMEEKSVYGLK